MARTGTFGRQPRVAPSLQATLIAIAREFQQQRDQNIMDAWQKGGTFEGHKVTDALVLAHWKDRLNGISPDDPLHDTYANAVLQIDYSIHESKMTALYSQHKASDGQMIAFYLGWAKKVPKDSEFYRVLQRDAGQYMRVSRASGAAAAKRAAEERYQSTQAATRQSKEAAGEFMIDTLRRLAQSGYVNGGIGAPISAPGSGSDLTDFDPRDPEVMLQLLRAITSPTGTKGHGDRIANSDVLYHDDDKKGVTGQAILDQLGKLDPSFKADGQFDVGYVTGLLDRQVQGLDARIALANSTGHLSDAASLEKSKSYVATLDREVGAWPIQKAYTELRSTFDSVANDPNASPQAVLKAWQTYSGELTQLAGDPRIAADDNLRSRLLGEAKGESGMPTLNESFTGLQTGAFDETSAKDSANTAAHMKFLQDQVEAVANGKAVWTFGKTNAAGVFVPQAGGSEIGASEFTAIQAGGANMQTMTVDDPKGGTPLTMYVTATPVYAAANDPKTGLALHPENANPVGYAYDIVKGGKTLTYYGFQTKDQGFVFSSDPPWDASLKMSASSTGGNHLEVDLTPVVTQGLYGGRDATSGALKSDINLGKNIDFGNGFHVQGASVSAKGVVSPGDLTFDPFLAVTATSDRNATGSADPTSDFHSLTLTYLMDSRDGLTILNNLDKNPQFKTQLDNDANTYAGVQIDPKTGAWVPGTGDMNKLAAAQQQINLASNVTSLTGFIDAAVKLWQRSTTGTPFQGGANPTVPGQSGAFAPADVSGKPLATDLLKGTPFEWLGQLFTPGTNAIKAPSGSAEADDFAIRTQGTIKVPAVPVTSLAPKPIDLATATVAAPSLTTPTQTGSTAPVATMPTSSPVNYAVGGTGSTAPTRL